MHFGVKTKLIAIKRVGNATPMYVRRPASVGVLRRGQWHRGDT